MQKNDHRLCLTYVPIRCCEYWLLTDVVNTGVDVAVTIVVEVSGFLVLP